MKQLSCDQCRERWDELINKSTFEADLQFADVQAHLESCADCQKTFDLLVASRQELQHLPAQKASASLRANILSQLEKPQMQSLSWWQSVLVSPQRLAWASGAIVAVFVVALLMRPENQTQVLQTAPQVLSNRGQVEQHNNMSPQPPVAPQPSVKKQSTKKAAQQNSQIKSPATSTTNKSKIQKSPDKIPTQSHLADNSQQQPVAAAPKSTQDKNQEVSAPPKIQLPQKSKQQNSVSPQPQLFSPPSPINNNSIANESTTKEATGFAKSSPQDSANQHDSMNRAIARESRGGGSVAGSAQAFSIQKVPAAIHWSRTITSDYEVANAKITITLGSGLAFEDNHSSTCTLWTGTLHRGKQIPLEIDLHRTSDNDAKVHILMIDTDTEKVLLDKDFKLP